MSARVIRQSRNAAIAVALLAGLGFMVFSSQAQVAANPPNTGMADPAMFISAFDRFVSAGTGASLVIPLVSLRGITGEGLNAGGRVAIDLVTGQVASQVRLMPPGETFELWLMDNRPGTGHSTLPDPQDVQVKVGAYTEQSPPGTYRLSVTLEASAFSGFFPDRAFVVRTNQSPSAGSC